MGNALTIQQFREVMSKPSTVDEFKRALPPHIDPDRFIRNVQTAISQNPRLLECDVPNLLREAIKSASLGLFLDTHLGEAAMVPAKGGECQLRVMYKGRIKLARQSGLITYFAAHDVCENDTFECEFGLRPKLIHKINFKTPRGKPYCYYASFTMKDGTDDFEVMTIDEIHRVRDRSGYKNPAWTTDEGEMSKKTVINRLSKRAPQSPELAGVPSFDLDDGPDFEPEPIRDVTPPPASIADAVPVARRGRPKKAETPAAAATADFDPQTGEVIDQEASDSAQAPSTQPAPATATAPASADQSWGGDPWQ